MKRTLISVFRLATLVGVLVLLPYMKAQQFIDACQTFDPPTSSPCPSCCPTHVEIPDVPFSTGDGIQGLVATPYSCGTQPSSSCPDACSGTTYVAENDANCCVLTGGACDAGRHICCDASAACSGSDGKSGTCQLTSSGGTGTGTRCGGTGADGEPQPECPTHGPSPIILDLNGKGFVLTDATHGVVFDISGTENPIRLGWTAPGVDNAFLALPGADGLVHNGKQLFGNFTQQPPSDNPNGFAALGVYDLPANGGNGDGVIDSRDAIFAHLRLWIDANHDGICQPDELHTLPSMGVNSISLKYKLSEKTDQYGNVFRYRAPVNPDDPDASRVDRKAYDVFFVTLGQPTP